MAKPIEHGLVLKGDDARRLIRLAAQKAKDRCL